uniref:Uncharacterized protein n=1 Tax=Medicago truncatula TaxID=3880 RepID=I3SA49_MEDTR|nr:unknown [Medicago truncatula]
MLEESKHASNGATDSTLFIFLSEAFLRKSRINGLYTELCNSVKGIMVLILVPPFPFLSIDNKEGFKFKTLPSTFTSLTSIKYSTEGTP